MEVLIMGGTGFVSEAIAKHLIANGYTVDILTRGLRPVDYLGIRNHLKANRQSTDELKSVLSDREYDFIFDISAYIKSDVETLLSVVNRNKLKRFIFCSTGGVYTSSEERVKENAPRISDINQGKYASDSNKGDGYLSLIDKYVFNKKEAEDFLFSLFEVENLPITIFRPVYIYGEKNNAYREAYFFDRINNNLPIPIPYGRNGKAHFIYIEDLARLFESAMTCDKAIGKAYNATNGEDVSWEYYVETAMDIMGKRSEVKKIDVKKYDINPIYYFPFIDEVYLLDNENVINDGLYVAKTNLKEGLLRSYQWYCQAKPQFKGNPMPKIDYVLNECQEVQENHRSSNISVNE